MLCRPIYTRSQITTEYTQITSIPSPKPESGLKITRRYYKDNVWMNQRYNKKAVNLGDQILHIDDLSSPCKDHEMDIDDMLVVLTEDTVEYESEEMLGNNTVVSIDSEEADETLDEVLMNFLEDQDIENYLSCPQIDSMSDPTDEIIVNEASLNKQDCSALYTSATDRNNSANYTQIHPARLESASCAVYDHSKTYTPEETINDDSINMDTAEAPVNMNESDNMETVEALAQESTQANNDPDFTPPKKRRITRKPGKKNQKEKIKKIKKNNVKPSKKELTGRRKNGQNKEINIDKGGKVYSVTCGDQKGQFYLDKFSSGGVGECILYRGEFVTPRKFEILGGREQSKKYKQSIKVNGRPLEELLKLIGNEGIKRPRQLINKTKRISCKAAIDKTKSKKKLKNGRKKVQPRKHKLVRTNDQSPSNIFIEKEHEVFDDSKRDNLDSYDENFDNEDHVLDTTFGLFNVEDEFDFNDTNTSFAYEFDDIELAETSENYNLMNVDGAYDQDILESNNELPCTTKGYLPVEVQSILSVNESKKEYINIYNSGTPKDKNKKEKRSKKKMFSCKDMNAYKIPKHKKIGKKQIKLHVYKKFHNIRDIHPKLRVTSYMPQCEGINYVSGNFTSTPTKECIEKGTEHPMAQYIPFTIEEEHPDNLIDSAVNELEEGQILSPTNIQENTDDDPNRILTRMIEWPKYSTSNTESGYFGEITGPQGFGRIPDTAQPKDNADNINPKYSGWYDLIKKVQEKKDTNCTIDTNEGTDPTLPMPGTSSANNASVFKPIPYDYDHQYHNIASLDPVVCKRNLMAVIGDHGYASRVEDDANEVVGNGNTICNTNNEVTESMYRIEDNNEAESYCLHIPEVQDPSTEDTFNAANTAEIHSMNDDINALVTGQLEFGTDNVAMENENATKDCYLKKKLQNHSNIEKEFTEGDRAEESHYNNSNSHELNLENAEFIDLSPSMQTEHDALDKLMERYNISNQDIDISYQKIFFTRLWQNLEVINIFDQSKSLLN